MAAVGRSWPFFTRPWAAGVDMGLGDKPAVREKKDNTCKRRDKMRLIISNWQRIQSSARLQLNLAFFHGRTKKDYYTGAPAILNR